MEAVGRVQGGGARAMSKVQLVQAAHEFEAQMMKELIRPMTRCDEDGSEMGPGRALSEFAGEALGQALSRGGGFGIANRILASLSRNETDCESGPILGKPGDRIAKDLKFPDGWPIVSSGRIVYGDPEQR